MSLWDKTPSTLTSFTPLSSEVQASGNFLTRWFRKGKGKFIVSYLPKILDMLGQTIDPEALIWVDLGLHCLQYTWYFLEYLSSVVKQT